MSERFFETEDKRTYETPENNVKMAALNLLRHKMLIQVGKGSPFPMLELEDVNEILIVAGLPVIIPAEINKKQLEVVK